MRGNEYVILFQYIICVGSSDDKKVIKDPVTGVSIHHMCRFKFIHEKAERSFLRFQYIICVGSS